MKRLLISGGLAAAALAAGCASSPELSAAQIVRAETTIENAANSGAPRYAATAMEDAREKLTAAKLAAQNGDEERAVRLAEEAELDAQVAMARAQQAEAENSLREIQSGIETLRQELQRDQYRPGGTQ